MISVRDILRKHVHRLCSVHEIYRKQQQTIKSPYGRYETFVYKNKCHRKYFSNGLHLHKEASRGKDTFLSTLIQSWTDRLTHADVPEAQSSVNLIVANALGKKMIHEVDINTVPSGHTLRSIDVMCGERLKRVPVQYIIGEWDFHDMTLEMRSPVLIPRPETEELADMIVKEWPFERDEKATFLEIGCGTGALSLYLLRKLPNVECVAVDKSETACELTLSNASRYNLRNRICMILGDIFQDHTISELSRRGPYSVIVSNPPYLTSDEMDNLETEVDDFEDHDALYGGPDGLDIVREILAESNNLLKDNQSVIWLEVGLEQPEKIKRIVELQPEFMLSYQATLKDFTRRERFCKLQLKK